MNIDEMKHIGFNTLCLLVFNYSFKIIIYVFVIFMLEMQVSALDANERVFQVIFRKRG